MRTRTRVLSLLLTLTMLLASALPAVFPTAAAAECDPGTHQVLCTAPTVCTVCGATGITDGTVVHADPYNTYNASYHWNACRGCKAVWDKEQHWGSHYSTYARETCQGCGRTGVTIAWIDHGDSSVYGYYRLCETNSDLHEFVCGFANCGEVLSTGAHDSLGENNTCSLCGAHAHVWASDSYNSSTGKHTIVCTVCQESRTHIWSKVYTAGQENHIVSCKTCGLQVMAEDHTAVCGNPDVCTLCGQTGCSGTLTHPIVYTGEAALHRWTCSCGQVHGSGGHQYAANGNKGFICSVCRYSVSVVLPRISAENTASGVRLTWTKASGKNLYTDGYTVLRNGKQIASLSGTTRSYTDTTAKANVRYTYTVKPVFGYEADTLSGPVSSGLTWYFLARMAAPNTENTATATLVSWKKAAGADGYRIYRNGTLIRTVTGSSTLSLTDSGAGTNGTLYKYTVEAYRTVNRATCASPVSAETSSVFLARPKIASAVLTDAGKVTLTWSGNDQASGYQIQYSTDKSFSSGVKTKTVNGKNKVSKVISSLKAGKKYWFRLRTFRTVGGTKYWSAWSKTKSVKVPR